MAATAQLQHLREQQRVVIDGTVYTVLNVATSTKFDADTAVVLLRSSDGPVLRYRNKRDTEVTVARRSTR